MKECEDWYIRRRLETVIEATNAKIKDVQYDSTDVKYFLLIDELKTQEQLAEAREINRIWREGLLHQLNVDECLALKVKLQAIYGRIQVDERAW